MADKTPTTIQQARKKWKLHQIIGVGLLLVGLVIALPDQGGFVGPLMLLVGIVWYIAARVMTWWHRG